MTAITEAHRPIEKGGIRTRPAVTRGFGQSSIEMTAAEALAFEDRGSLPAGTRVNIPHLASDTEEQRREAAVTLRAQGLTPVVHVAARRLRGRRELRAFLTDLHEQNLSQHLFVVGGDPARPAGPYEAALSVIHTENLGLYGVECVGVAAYPEGHAKIASADLWAALQWKIDAIRSQGLRAEIITQVSFDPHAVLGWIEELRARGFDDMVRIGLVCDADHDRAVSFAQRLGIRSALALGGPGPSRSATRKLTEGGFADQVREGYSSSVHGAVAQHHFTLGSGERTLVLLRAIQFDPIP
ncbi:methylenetetrahydrofolate reductase [Microbacterium sp.]|uniref:methylenetetrahydrofolate reductase n=1 Tax=Microbacterium sp. TaxID=51671 RepID=UPI0035AE41A8